MERAGLAGTQQTGHSKRVKINTKRRLIDTQQAVQIERATTVEHSSAKAVQW